MMVEERIIEDSLELVKKYWRENVYADEWYLESDGTRGYLEIIHTQIAYIKDEITADEGIQDTAEMYFDDVSCVVEFQIMSDYYASDPYCFNVGLNNCVAVYRDGRMEVLEKSLFDIYRSRTYSMDFSGIVDSVKNLGPAYDAVYYLLEE